MELRHLRTFCTVAETLNFTRAAEQLHIAQSALSRQVQALEHELGLQLFVRNRQRVHLTDAGRVFFGQAQKILGQVDLAVLSAREVVKGTEGELRIGLDWRLFTTIVPEAVAEYRKRFPRVDISVREVPMTEQLVALHTRKIHLGVIAERVLGPDDQLSTRMIYRTDLVVLVPLSHPMAGRSSVRLAELRKEEWILVADHPDNGYRTFMLQMCRGAGFAPRFSRAVATQPSSLVSLVASGMGIALAPRSMLSTGPAHFAVLATDCDPVNIYAVWLKDNDSPLLHNFLRVLEKLKSHVMP